MNSEWGLLLAALVQKLRADKRIPEWVTTPLSLLIGLGCAFAAANWNWNAFLAGNLGLWMLAALGVTQATSSAANSGILDPSLKTNSQGPATP